MESHALAPCLRLIARCAFAMAWNAVSADRWRDMTEPRVWGPPTNVLSSKNMRFPFDESSISIEQTNQRTSPHGGSTWFQLRIRRCLQGTCKVQCQSQAYRCQSAVVARRVFDAGIRVHPTRNWGRRVDRFRCFWVALFLPFQFPFNALRTLRVAPCALNAIVIPLSNRKLSRRQSPQEMQEVARPDCTGHGRMNSPVLSS